MSPDLTRTDVHAVLVAERAADTTSVEEVFAELDRRGWPSNLLSFNAFGSTDGETVLIYTQWRDGAVVPEVVGGDPVEYRLYRSGVRDDPPPVGCVVVVRVEFDGPDDRRQRQWVDTVFDALAGETDPPAGGISGHFHASTDGTRVLNYAEWETAQHHIDALAAPGDGVGSPSALWQRVQTWPGLKGSTVKRYEYTLGLLPE